MQVESSIESSMYLIYKEGGFSVSWFTELLYHKEPETVTILAHYRLHWDEYDSWPERCKKAPSHPRYYGSNIICENEERFVTGYFVPHANKWIPVNNSKHIFHYDEPPVETEIPSRKIPEPSQKGMAKYVRLGLDDIVGNSFLEDTPFKYDETTVKFSEAVLVFLIKKITNKSVEEMKKMEMTRITPRHLQLAIRGDTELDALLEQTVQGGPRMLRNGDDCDCCMMCGQKLV